MNNGKIAKNYLLNTLYQILVMIAPLVTTPYVSRVLGVTNIGIFQYSQSISTYFVLLGAAGTTLYGQREIAYLQDKPAERTKAFWEIELFRVLAVLLCVIIYGAAFCVNGEYHIIYQVLMVEVIATAFDITWLYMGMEDFKLTVIRNTIIKLTGVICVFVFVKGPNDLIIYTLCMTLPILLGNISLWISLGKYVTKFNFSLNALFIGAMKRLSPILILFIPQIAQEVYLVLDKTMIGLLGSSVDQVGYYSQAQKIIRVILAIVTSLGIVMLPAMSAYFARGDHEGIKKSIKTAFRFIYMISFPLMFGLCAIAERFVPFFFGAGYDPVSGLMILISPILIIIATSNVIGKQYLIPTNQQKAFTASIIAGAGVNFVLNLILIHFFDAVGASIATVLAELAVTGVQCWFVRKQLPLKELIGSGVRYFLLGLIMFIVCYIVGAILPKTEIWPIAVMVAAGVAVYVAGLFISKDPMIKTGLDMIKKKL